MTSKKRVDLAGTEEGGEPKRPRGEEEKQEVEGQVAAQEEGPQEPAARGAPRNWLSFSGRRRPRVGDDFQVTALPSPADKKEESTEPQEEGKEEVKEG